MCSGSGNVDYDMSDSMQLRGLYTIAFFSCRPDRPRPRLGHPATATATRPRPPGHTRPARRPRPARPRPATCHGHRPRPPDQDSDHWPRGNLAALLDIKEVAVSYAALSDVVPLSRLPGFKSCIHAVCGVGIS